VLQEIFQRIKTCTKCSLRTSCKQVIPGEGVDDSKVVLLGESPTAEDEDAEAGKPLSDRIGIMIRLNLLHAGLRESEVTIINTVCCRPPDNRSLTFEETDACWPWVEEILNAVKPKVIMTLGRPALSTLSLHYGFSKKIGQLGITKLAGKPIYLEARKLHVYPIIRPTFVPRGEQQVEFTGYFQFLGRALPGWIAQD
jgi:uracil-DNA glycosylase family 4